MTVRVHHYMIALPAQQCCLCTADCQHHCHLSSCCNTKGSLHKLGMHSGNERMLGRHTLFQYLAANSATQKMPRQHPWQAGTAGTRTVDAAMSQASPLRVAAWLRAARSGPKGAGASRVHSAQTVPAAHAAAFQRH